MFDIFDDLGFFQIPTTYREELRCPVCKKSFSDFEATGRLGCSKCYEVFSAYIEPSIRQIHNNANHLGKIPQNKLSKISKKRKLEMLRAELTDAVKHENYEKAAKIHKQISEYEKG